MALSRATPSVKNKAGRREQCAPGAPPFSILGEEPAGPFFTNRTMTSPPISFPSSGREDCRPFYLVELPGGQRLRWSNAPRVQRR